MLVPCDLQQNALLKYCLENLDFFRNCGQINETEALQSIVLKIIKKPFGHEC